MATAARRASRRTTTTSPASSTAGCSRPTTRTSARSTSSSRSSRRLIGVGLSVLMRIELQHPGMQIFADGQMWNAIVTAHGLIMVFFVVMPALIGGFGNWFVPLMIGAPDMAFPRMNNISFWLLVPAFLLLLALGLFVGEGAGRRLDDLSAAVATASTSPAPAMDLALFSLHLAGASLDPGRDQLHHHHLQHARAGHDAAQDAAVRLVDAGHRLPAAAGGAGAGRRHHHADHRPQLRHRLLRARGRRRPGAVPAPVLVLRPPRSLHHDPAGLRHHQPRHLDLQPQADLRLPRHGLRHGRDRRRRLRRVGAPHVHGRAWTSTRAPTSWPRRMVIAVPTGIKIFSWIATMWGGSIELEDADAVGDRLHLPVHRRRRDRRGAGQCRRRRRSLHNTYYVVAHFHYVLSLGAVFGIFAGFYYWIGKMSRPAVSGVLAARSTSG